MGWPLRRRIIRMKRKTNTVEKNFIFNYLFSKRFGGRTTLHLCTTWIAFHEEMTFLKNFFATNGYPLYLFDRVTKTFLCQKFSNQPSVLTAKKDHRYVKLPYMGKLSFEVRKQLKTLLQNNYPQMKFTFVFSNTNTIGKFFKQQSKCDSNLVSNVVYIYVYLS